MKNPPITEEEMRAAWLERRRADWPPTFEQTIQDDFLLRVVRLYVVHQRLEKEIVLSKQRAVTLYSYQRDARSIDTTKQHAVSKKDAAAGEKPEDL